MTALPTAREQGRMSWDARRRAELRLQVLKNSRHPDDVRELAALYYERLPQDPPLVVARRQQVLEARYTLHGFHRADWRPQVSNTHHIERITL